MKKRVSGLGERSKILLNNPLTLKILIEKCVL